MNNDNLAYTLARALFRSLKNIDEMNGVENDLELASKIASENKGIELFFNHPRIPLEQKRELMSSVFAHGITSKLIDILLLVKDVRLVTEIHQYFHELVREKTGTVDAEVQLPWEPTTDELGRLKATLEKTTGKKVLINLKIAPEILGGAWVKIGDKIFDNTIRKELASLKSKAI